MTEQEWIQIESCETAIVMTIAKRRLADGSDGREIHTLLEEMVQSDHLHLVIDLSTVQVLPPSVVKMFELLAKRLGQQERRLILCGVQTDILRLFATIGLDRLFRTYHDRKEALNAVRT